MIYFDGICYECRLRGEREAFLRLTRRETEKELAYIAEHITEKDIVNNRLLPIACFHDSADISACQWAAFENGLLYPGVIYKNASAALRDRMIELLEKTEDTLRANHLLCALAHIGDAEVCRRYGIWTQHPPAWREKLHIDAKQYAQDGGWELDPAGKRRNLYFGTAYPLVSGNRSADKAVQIGKLLEEKCDCGTPLCEIMRLDLSDERLAFLGKSGVVSVIGCPNCVCWNSAMFCKIRADGSSEVLKTDGFTPDTSPIPADSLREIETNTLVLGKTPVGIWSSAHCFLPSGFCQIGGLPGWVQDFAYLDCPRCGKKMIFFAQLQWDIILDGWEGILYFHICPDCDIAGVNHPQT
jgi:hypothetical protein